MHRCRSISTGRAGLPGTEGVTAIGIRIDPDNLGSAAEFEFSFNGRAVTARDGETIAAALMANGYSAFRRDGQGAPRGPYCLVGSCFECLVEIIGSTLGTPSARRRQHVRACLTLAAAELEVRTAPDAVEIA